MSVTANSNPESKLTPDVGVEIFVRARLTSFRLVVAFVENNFHESMRGTALLEPNRSGHLAKELVVPERAFDSLRALAKASKSAHAGFRASLLEADAFLTPESFTSLVTKSFPDALSREQSEAFVGEVFAMTHLINDHGYSAAEIGAQVAGYEALEIPRAEQPELAGTISATMSATSVKALATAAFVYGEHDRLYADSSVFVDVRPVFDKGSGEVLGAVLTRKLRIEYFEDGELRSVEIAFQERNYDQLNTALQAGKRDSLGTEQLLRTAGVNVFKFDQEDEES